MNIQFVFVSWCSWCLFLLCVSKTDGFCPDDEELQSNRCKCNLQHRYVQCSSLPKKCRTCKRYDAISFDQQVDIVPLDAFENYAFFAWNANKSFTIQFALIRTLSIRAFSRIDINPNCSLVIKISQYSSAIVPARTFEDVSLKVNSILDVEIFRVTSQRLFVEQYAFDGIKFGNHSEFRFAILSLAKSLGFEPNAGTMLIPKTSSMHLYFSNFDELFLQERSFDHITQEHSSSLQISFDRFNTATLAHESFYDFHQLDDSYFYLSLSNFRSLNIEKTLFYSISQLQSSMTLSLYNMSTDLCLPPETFGQIKQDMNSTFQFHVNIAKNILFHSQSFVNISQRAQSKFAILISSALDVYFTKQSLYYFRQNDRSFLDIWIKYGKNLIFEDNAIQNVDIWRSSILRIGFQHSYGALQIATNAFGNIREADGGEILFQIINSTDFYLRFNQSIKLERLEIVDRILNDNDLCRIIDVPSHIPIQVLSENHCSCSIYYLYRNLRYTLPSLKLQELTPICYRDALPDVIENEERKCSFDKRVHDCRQMQGNIKIYTPNGLCERPERSRNNYRHRSSSLSFIFILMCSIVVIVCIYMFSRSKGCFVLENMLYKFNYLRHRRQRLPIFTADSYQQLTHGNETVNEDDAHEKHTANKVMKIIVKYNSETDQTEPYLHCSRSDFVSSNDPDDEPNEDVTLQLNTNPFNDIEQT